jgi:hypothetical protein
MHHHRSIGTAALVALMAAHRAAAEAKTGTQPLRTHEIDRALERLWQPAPHPSGSERQSLA